MLGIGQSACVGIGGDPLHGTSFFDVLQMFEEDQNTEAIVMIGEIGGTREQAAAKMIKESISKPVVASSKAKLHLKAEEWKSRRGCNYRKVSFSFRKKLNH